MEQVQQLKARVVYLERLLRIHGIRPEMGVYEDSELEEAEYHLALANYEEGKTLCTCSETVNQWAAIVKDRYEGSNYQPYRDVHLRTCGIWYMFAKPDYPMSRKPDSDGTNIYNFAYSFPAPCKGKPFVYPMKKTG